MNKITHLTSLHSTQDIRIFHKQCRSLYLNGYEVILIANSDSPERIDWITIIAIPEQNSRLKRFLFSSWAVYKKSINSNARICHFHDPELIFIAILLKLKGRKVIYDVHEDLPRQILTKNWIHPLLRYPVSWSAALTEWIGSRFFFSAIVPATPKIANRFPASKTVLVQNFPILEELQSREPVAWNDRNDNVIYIGGIADIRGALENIRAMEFVKYRGCQFILAGPFKNRKLEKQCRAMKGWERCEYYPWLSRNEVQNVLAKVKIGLILFHPLPNHVDAQPNKLFEYMSAGLPVIASDFPLWREIVEGNDCGLLVDPLSPEQIAEAIDWLLEHAEEAEEMGRNGRRAVEEKYNWGMEEKKLLDLYKRLAS